MDSSCKNLILVLLLCAAAAAVCEAQTGLSCASNLTACANYLNSTNPPSSCCTLLNDTIKNDLPCLCRLYTSPGVLTSLGINVTQALELPKNCKISGNLSDCSTATASPPSISTTPAATPGSGNGAERFTSARIFSFLLLWAIILLC